MEPKTLELKLSRALVAGHDLLRVELQAVRGAPLAPEVALVLDRSGSMAGGKLAEAKAAARLLLSALPETGRLALVAYDHEVEVGGFSREEALGFLEGLEARGNTALHAGWKMGTELLRNPSRPRFVLLLTDGLANVGLTDPEALVQEAAKAAEAGVYTFTLGFGEGYDRELLAGMALAGGGTHLYAAQGELQEALEGELAFLRGPVNLGARLALGEQVRHLAPFAPGERRVVLLRVEGEMPLEVEERTPHGKVSRLFPLPPRAPKGSPDWHLVELEELLAAGARLLAAEPQDKEEAKALRQQALDLKELLEGHPLAQNPRAQGLVEALEAFAGTLAQLARRFDIHLSDRAAREGRAYATRLFSEERTLAQRYRKRS
ncbi:vWA domain-containing protein [Thermus caliditerrae]|uniref:vWA domain-containing protein n=1 Tax=Thermus caliditerrae TaxID=1330700 RepID=UPI001F203955|nr:VWA domain-containing protein [Thermus caliditerrae]